MTSLRYLVGLAFAAVAAACGSLQNAGTDTGQGTCFYGAGGIQSVASTPNACFPTQAGSFCAELPVCAPPGTLGEHTRVVDWGGGDCYCSLGGDLGPLLLDPPLQKTDLLSRNPKELFAACKDFRCLNDEQCYFWLVEPRKCFQLGFINGFAMTGPFGLGGNDHDSDENLDVCPIPDLPAMTMGAQGVLNGADVRKPIDLRSAPPFGRSDGFKGLHTEVPWCRWYGGPITVETDSKHPEPVRFSSFLPDRQGQRISMVGDWIVDGDRTEIHDIRFAATVKSDRRVVNGTEVTCDVRTTPGCARPDTWHVLASGFFAKDTAQQDRLSITVPLPTSPDPILDTPEASMPTLSAGGCIADNAEPTIVCDKAAKTCTIIVERRGGFLPPRTCATNDVCPCGNRKDDPGWLCSAKKIASYADFDQCKPRDGVSEIAFARDVRVDWVDPLDLWNCECECDDPSKAGAVIRARVQGCALPGADQDSGPRKRRLACEQACGGVMCGGAPHCRIGACRIQAVGTPPSDQIAQLACEPPVPSQRVARAGDFRVELNPSASVLRVGDMDTNLNLSEKGRTTVSGTVWFNRTASNPVGLDIAEMKLGAADFTIQGGFFGRVTLQVTNTTMFILNRMPATIGQDGKSFTVAAGQVKVGSRARIDGKPGGTEFINQGPFTGVVDFAAGTFSVDGRGRTPQGQGLVFHLEGTLANRPPSSNPGPDRVVECQSPSTTPVSLDGSASSDPDTGDAISHFQWFKGSVAVSNQSMVTVGVVLGDNRYRLHVYDRDLGSHSAEQNVRVVDTTPPELTFEQQEWCLWPPNHDFALFTLGREIPYTATDKCDPNPPVVRLVSVTSDESSDATGSGSTSPDIHFGPTSACVRAERSGRGTGRTYLAIVEAVDVHGNATRKKLRIVVPHNLSDHRGCIRAAGMADVDARCTQ